MNFRKYYLHFLLFSTFLLFTCSSPKKNGNNYLIISGGTMGTTYTIKIVKNNFLLLGDASKKNENLKDGITSLLQSINNKMSTYIPSSEISLFNNSRKISWMNISPETAFVISNSIRISKMSGGAFDITIGPLINLWGFGPNRKPIEIPSDLEIKLAKGKIGYKKIFVKNNPPAIKKSDYDIYCDLSAIAKGYGVDKVASFLDSKGFYNYMVEIGGEISVRGRNSNGKEWRLGILSPDGSNEVKKIISISNLAMATSGDYHNYFEEKGVRYSHTIDPDTGRPITHKLVSVTVIMKSCMEADALATAINVMGPIKGYKFAVKNSIPIYMIVKEGNGYIEKMNPLFSKFPAIIQKK